MLFKKGHIFHLVDPSPWPLSAAFIILNILLSMLLYMNKYHILEISAIMCGVLFLSVIMWWLIDIVREGLFEGKHTFRVQSGLKTGMILFIVSEVMFFFGFFWAYFHFALSPTIEIGLLWPPYGIQAFEYTHIPLYNTAVLLLSGVCVTWCHHGIISRKKDLDEWEANFPEITKIGSLILTICLAVHFTLFQMEEYVDSTYNISDSVYGSIFFMATGFHGIHVCFGTCFLLACLIRLWKGHFGLKHHLGLEFAIWYWHFVDVVWLFLFVFVYWWPKACLEIL